MKKLFLILILVSLSAGLSAQANHSKLSTEIKKLSGEWTTGFKNLKGAILYESDVESIFLSRFKLSGTIDSTNRIHYVKDRQIWSFSADFINPGITMAMLDSLITSIYYSFGEIKGTSTNTPWGKAYVPASKKGASEKLRCFYLLLYDHGKDPKNRTGRKLSLTVSDDDYFRAR